MKGVTDYLSIIALDITYNIVISYAVMYVCVSYWLAT